MPDTAYSPAADRELRAYLATPRGDGPWPGVVVIMDALGLSDDIRLQADRLAAAGYLAFAPDLYSGRGIRCVVATLAASRSGRGEAYTDIEAARRWLDGRADCCPVVASFGGRDPELRGRAERLERALTQLGVEHDVKEYPGVGHAFMNRINVGPALNPLMRFVRMNYDHPSAEDSWRRILTFFDTHLAPDRSA